MIEIKTTVILILGLIGLGDALYLFIESRRKEPLVCPLNFNCSAVINSQWAKTFGIKNDILGVLFYAGFVLLNVGYLFFSDLKELIGNLRLLMAVVSAGFSVYLIYIQTAKIKNFCFYCLISAGVSFFILLALLFL